MRWTAAIQARTSTIAAPRAPPAGAGGGNLPSRRHPLVREPVRLEGHPGRPRRHRRPDDRRGGLGLCSAAALRRSRSSQQPAPNAQQDELSSFVGFVLDDVQKTFDQQLEGYQVTRLTLFASPSTPRAGTATSAIGPFYCPLDKRVFIDLRFYDDPAAGSARRVTRAGVRHRARGRPPRAEPSRQARQGRGQPDSRPSSRPMPRRCVGPRTPTSADCSRSAMSTRRSTRGPDRRRHDPAQDVRPRPAGDLDARLGGAALERVQEGSRRRHLACGIR